MYAPPPHIFFGVLSVHLEICWHMSRRQIMSFLPTKYLKWQQNMKEIAVFECENAKIVQARSFIDFLNVSVLSVYFRFIAPYRN